MFNFDEAPSYESLNEQQDVNLEGIDIDDKTGQLTSVEDLADEANPGVSTSTEGLSQSVQTTPADSPTMGNQGQKERKPAPPVVYPHNEGMVYHLAGDIEYTVIVLVAALGLARKGDKISVELHAPYSDEAGLATVASAIEASAAEVDVHIGQCISPGEAMIAMVANKLSVGSGTWIIEPLRFWTRGSSNACIDSADQHAEYANYVYSIFKDRGLLTEEEIDTMNEFTKTIFLEAEEVRARLGLTKSE